MQKKINLVDFELCGPPSILMLVKFVEPIEETTHACTHLDVFRVDVLDLCPQIVDTIIERRIRKGVRILIPGTNRVEA